MDQDFDSPNLPCQLRDRSLETQLEYSADKMFNSGVTPVKSDINQIYEQLINQQQSTLQSLSKGSRHSIIEFQVSESISNHATYKSQIIDHDGHISEQSQLTQYGDCDVSEVKKNLSINQELSLNNCEKALQTEEHFTEQNIKSIFDLRHSKINESLKASSRLRTEQREIMVKNNQIVELQKRILEAEQNQIQRQSEDIANSQILERKVSQLQDQIQYLQQQYDRVKNENLQLQVQLQSSNEQNMALQNQLNKMQDSIKNQWANTEQDEYLRLKQEFQEYQRLTHDIVDQDDDCQRRLQEQEEELHQQAIIQNELVNQLREQEETFEQRMMEMKDQFQMECEQALRRMQEQYQGLREQNQYLFDKLQTFELEKQGIEEYFINEIEVIKGQCNQKCIQLETQLKINYEKHLQDKNNVISQLQEQIRQGVFGELSAESGIRSKSLSACNGINKFTGIMPSSKNPPNYYLPPYRANISLDEDQYGRVKQNNSFHNSSQHQSSVQQQQNPSHVASNHVASNQNQNNSFTYQKKQSQVQNYVKNLLNSNQKPQQQQASSVDKENVREWEKSALLLSQKKQKEQCIQFKNSAVYRDQYAKQKNNLYLRQLDGEYKYSPNVQPESRSRYTNNSGHQNSTNLYRYNNDTNVPPKNPSKKI